jgi:hypothetical protein
MRPRTRWSLVATLGWLVATGCPNPYQGDDDDAGDDDTSGDDDDSCDRFDTLGTFTVGVNRNGGTFSGVYWDGPDPGLLDSVLEEDGCAFYRYVPRECDPPCDPPLACAFDETCRPWPQYLSVGTISVTGTDPPLEIEPTEFNSYYTTEVYEDLFGPGDALTVSAAGSFDVGPFSVTVAGVPLLEPYEQTVTMVEGEPLVISWTPADGPDDAVVRVHLDNDHHGVAAYAECEVPSAEGQILVPESIVEKMIEAGGSGIGTYVENAYLVRTTRSEQRHDPGCVVVSSSSEARLYVDTVLR